MSPHSTDIQPKRMSGSLYVVLCVCSNHCATVSVVASVLVQLCWGLPTLWEPGVRKNSSLTAAAVNTSDFKGKTAGVQRGIILIGVRFFFKSHRNLCRQVRQQRLFRQKHSQTDQMLFVQCRWLGLRFSDCSRATDQNVHFSTFLVTYFCKSFDFLMRSSELDFFLLSDTKTINLTIWRKCNYCYSCLNSKGGQHHCHNTITNTQRCTVWEVAFSTSQTDSSVMIWDETEELWVYSEGTEI